MLTDSHDSLCSRTDTKTKRIGEDDEIPAEDIARFRLLSRVVRAPANDEDGLGVHDANILFVSTFRYGGAEIRGLLEAGLDHYRSEAVPVWRWYAELDGFAQELLWYFTLYGPSYRRISAFKAMRAISEGLPNSGAGMDRQGFLNRWLLEENSRELKVAALNYLADLVLATDVPTIEREFENENNQTPAEAAEVIVRIYARDSREKAIQALYKLQPPTIAKGLVTALFNEQISTETLLQGIVHKTASVRRTTAGLLVSCGELPVVGAELLLEDDDPDLLEYLADKGRIFSDEKARSILVKQVKGKGLFFVQSALEGENCLEKFRRDKLLKLNREQLEAAVSAASIFDMEPFLYCVKNILVRKQYVFGMRSTTNLRKFLRLGLRRYESTQP
jgi:hypothetical protein